MPPAAGSRRRTDTDYHEFRRRLIQSLPVGTVIPNPGGGTSTIVSYTDRNVAYRRGRSTIRVAFRDLYDAYGTFRGRRVDSTTLREFNPGVFDSQHSGHSCNCTFLYMALRAMGIVDRIEGAGKRGNPFQVTIPREAN